MLCVFIDHHDDDVPGNNIKEVNRPVVVVVSRLTKVALIMDRLQALKKWTDHCP